MYALATCRASVLRGTSTNTWGDVSDNATVVASGVLAAISVRSRTITDSSTQTSRVVEVISCAMSSDTDVRDTDQIRDDTNGVTYAVEAVTQPGGAGFTADLQIELRRVK